MYTYINRIKLYVKIDYKQINWYSYTKLLLPVRGHETLLGFFGFGSFFHTLTDFGPLAVDFRLFCLLSLRLQKKKNVK